MEISKRFTYRNCLNCDYNCDGQIFISFVFPQFTSSSFYVSLLSRVKMNSIHKPIHWESQCMGLHSSVGRALQR